MSELDELLAAQRAHFAALDPLLPPAVAPPVENMITAALPDGRRVAGVIAHDRHPVGATQRLWTTADVWELLPLVGGDSGAGMDALIRLWVDRMREIGPPSTDSACVVTWPSRDARATKAFLDHGFSPRSVLAVRRTAPAQTPTASSRDVRRARTADMAEMVKLALAELRYSELVGAATFRDNAAVLKRDGLRKRLLDGDPVWVAERDGMTLALADCAWTPVTAGSWAGTRLRPGNWGYVNCVSVLPGARGNGIGRRLMDVVHAEFARGGATGTYLYYNPPNPLSSVFWPRQGYRPLWTLWEVRPATALR